MITDNRKPAADLKVGDWILDEYHQPIEVAHTQPIRGTDGRLLVVYADGSTQGVNATTKVVLADDDAIAAAKVTLARNAIADGLMDLANAYRDDRMPLPKHGWLNLSPVLDSEDDLRRMAAILDVPVHVDGSDDPWDDGKTRLGLEWHSGDRNARNVVHLRAWAYKETPAEVERSSAGTAGPGEEPATAPAGEETPAGAPLDQTRVDHDTAAILGAVARGVARAPRPGGTR